MRKVQMPEMRRYSLESINISCLLCVQIWLNMREDKCPLHLRRSVRSPSVSAINHDWSLPLCTFSAVRSYLQHDIERTEYQLSKKCKRKGSNHDLHELLRGMGSGTYYCDANILRESRQDSSFLLLRTRHQSSKECGEDWKRQLCQLSPFFLLVSHELCICGRRQ